MADNRKYYYLKLKEGFFDSEEIKILESMKDGYIYSNILLKLYLRSLRNEGRLMYRNVIPYTPEILATLVGHQVGTVEKALKVFKDLELIEILDNGAIYMMDIQNFIGQSSTEADRQRAYYAKVKEEKKMLESGIEPEIGIPELTEQEEDTEHEQPEPDEGQKPKKENTLQLFRRLSGDYKFSDCLKSKLEEWFRYKMERKEPYKEQGMKSLLRRIENQNKKYRDEEICSLIEECMSNNWKGIIWDILEKKQTQNRASDRIQNRVSEVDNW